MIPLPITLFGCKLSPLNRSQIRNYMMDSLCVDHAFRIAFLSEKRFFYTIFSKKWKQTLNAHEIVLSTSGQVSKMASTVLDHPVETHMPVTVVLDILRLSDEIGYTVAFFGGNRQSNRKLSQSMSRLFPNLHITASFPILHKGPQMDKVLLALKKAAPQILLCHFSSRAEEHSMQDFLTDMEASIIIHMEDAFAVLTGSTKMPPIWVQTKQLTAWYQTLCRPWDIWRLFRLLCLGGMGSILRIREGSEHKKAKSPALPAKKSPASED